MAAIAASQCTLLVQEGAGEQECFLRITDVTSGDTLDVSSLAPSGAGGISGTIAYKKMKCGYFHVAGALATQAAATLGGTGDCSLTLTLSTMADDTIYLALNGQV